jgi:hypothetical protein
MKTKFLVLCLSCVFLFCLNINCSSSGSITQGVHTQEETLITDNNNTKAAIEAAPVMVKAPKMVITNSSFSFPDVEDGTHVEHVWEIKNVGTDDLVINNIESSCGCTTAITESKIISPKGSTNIKTVFDTKGRIGMNTKFIVVHSNDPSVPARQLTILGRVIPKGISKN